MTRHWQIHAVRLQQVQKRAQHRALRDSSVGSTCCLPVRKLLIHLWTRTFSSRSLSLGPPGVEHRTRIHTQHWHVENTPTRRHYREMGWVVLGATGLQQDKLYHRFENWKYTLLKGEKKSSVMSSLSCGRLVVIPKVNRKNKQFSCQNMCLFNIYICI